MFDLKIKTEDNEGQDLYTKLPTDNCSIGPLFHGFLLRILNNRIDLGEIWNTPRRYVKEYKLYGTDEFNFKP